jgi:hypothetical protein
MFEVGRSINSSADWLIGKLGSSVKNPIYGALILTVIVIILICIVFEGETNVYKAYIKTFIYVLIILTGFLVLHDKSIVKTEQENRVGAKTEEMFKNLPTASIIPKIGQGEFNFNLDSEADPFLNM